jgi:hypothetical protein
MKILFLFVLAFSFLSLMGTETMWSYCATFSYIVGITNFPKHLQPLMGSAEKLLGRQKLGYNRLLYEG